MQVWIRESGEIAESSLRSVGAEDFFERALQQREFDKGHHRQKGLRCESLPATIIGPAARREKKGSPFYAVSDPRAVPFSFLEFSLSRKRPREVGFADPRQRQCFGFAEWLSDPGLQISPGLALTRPQALSPRVGQIGFG